MSSEVIIGRRGEATLRLGRCSRCGLSPLPRRSLGYPWVPATSSAATWTCPTADHPKGKDSRLYRPVRPIPQTHKGKLPSSLTVDFRVRLAAAALRTRDVPRDYRHGVDAGLDRVSRTPQAEASESAAAKALNLHSGDTAFLTSTRDDGTTSEFTMKVVIHRNARPTGDFTLPAERGEYVVADVTIKVARGSYDYNPFDFQGQSGNGQIWESTIPIGFDPALNAGTAAAGQTARGNVVFDVPGGPLQVQLTGDFGQSTAAAWKG